MSPSQNPGGGPAPGTETRAILGSTLCLPMKSSESPQASLLLAQHNRGSNARLPRLRVAKREPAKPRRGHPLGTHQRPLLSTSPPEAPHRSRLRQRHLCSRGVHRSAPSTAHTPRCRRQTRPPRRKGVSAQLWGRSGKVREEPGWTTKIPELRGHPISSSTSARCCHLATGLPCREALGRFPPNCGQG